MVEKYFEAIIKWISREDGGRKRLPRQGTRYCPIIRINEGEKFLDWSIDLICPDFSQSSKIEFKFLVDGAPIGLVELETQYELYEGKRKVAEIIVKKERQRENLN